MSDTDDAQPVPEPESEPSGTQVDQPPAAADDARPDELTSDTQGTGVDSTIAEQEPTGDAEGAGTTEPKPAAPPADAPPDATAPAQPEGVTSGESEVADTGTTEVPTAEPTEPTPPPFDERRSPILERLSEKLGDAIVATEVVPDRDIWARVRLDAWAETAKVLRDDLGFTYFCYLSAIDWLPSPFGKSEDDSAPVVADPDAALEHGVTGGETRFQLLARVEKPGTGIGITLKADVPDDALEAPTWTGVYAGANWHERETWEMFGITFAGHPYLVHLYLPGAFEGNPLRKDFPLLARMVKPWPGLVDVEPMPGEDPEQAEADA